MAWPYTFAALTAPQLSYLDSNFADAAQVGTAVNFSGIGGTTPGTGAFTALSASGAFSAAAGATISAPNGASNNLGIPFTPNGGVAAVSISKSGSNVATGLAINMQVTNDNFCLFTVGGTAEGSIRWTGSATAYNTTSDAALKTLHGPADGTTLAALPVRDASFTASPSTRHPMLIAQEVAAVCPWAVTEGDGTPENPSMIDHGALVPALLAYAQSLEARIATLEAAAKIATPPRTAAAVSCRAALAAVAKLPVMLAAFARGAGPSQGESVAAP